MALSNTTTFANRMGMDLKFYAYSADLDPESATPVATIDFANEVAVELAGDTTWATGGSSHANRIPFADPIEGSITISTQLMNNAALSLLVGTSYVGSDGTITFNNKDENRFFVITGTTVWKDENGTTYTENIKAFKAAPQRAYNVTYTGEGDPSSMDIVFDLAEDSEGNVFSTQKVTAA